MVNFDEFMKTWSLRSNSVTRQVSFNRTKIGGKCQNSKVQMWQFWVIFQQCEIGRFQLQFLLSTTKKIELWKVLQVCVFFVLSRNWVYMPRRFFMWVKKQLGAQVEENDPLCRFSRGVSTSGNSKHNFRRCPITMCAGAF